jgi:hypothetical protein
MMMDLADELGIRLGKVYALKSKAKSGCAKDCKVVTKVAHAAPDFGH